MAHHPPLYYTLNALLLANQNSEDRRLVFRPNPNFRWVENDGKNGWNVYIHAGQDRFPGDGAVRALFTVRLLGVLYGVVTLFALYRAFKIAFPAIRALPFLATSLIAFNPSFLFMSSTVHHDGLLAMWFAIGAWWMMVYLHATERWRPWLGGLIVGLAVLTKVTGAVLTLGVATVIIIRAYREKHWAIFWRDALAAGGVAVLVAGGWFVRNLLVYGDLLAWNAYTHNYQENLRPEPSIILGVRDFFQQLGRNYWGGFGYMHITFPEISRVLWIATAILLCGWLVLWFRDRRFFARHAAPLLVGAVLLLGMITLYLRFSIINLGAGHGRYLFPVAFALGMLPAVGLLGLSGRRFYSWAAGALTVGLFAYSIWLPLTQVVPRYAPPETVAALPLTAQALEREVSPGVYLAGYEFDTSQPLAPDTTRSVVLYWRADDQLAAVSDPYLKLALASPEGELLSSSSGWPAPGRPPESWPADELLVTRRSLYVGEHMLPAEVVLQITAENLSADPLTIATLPTLGASVQIELATLPDDMEILFGKTLRLRGYTLSSTAVNPGETIAVQLYWEVEATAEADYTLFVHLLDSSGKLWAQLDRPTGGVLTPMSTWEPGQAWRDIYPVQLPLELPPGEYTIQVGMYQWPSLDRIPITGVSDDVLPLGQVLVETDP